MLVGGQPNNYNTKQKKINIDNYEQRRPYKLEKIKIFLDRSNSTLV